MEKMQKSGLKMGGFQNGYGHTSLLMPGPVPKPDPAVFLSPQLHAKSRSIVAHDFGGTEESHLRNMLSPVGKQVQNGRNNSISHTSSTVGTKTALNPITGSPINLMRHDGA